MTPTGYVLPGTGNTVWAMQSLWPIKMQFVIAYVSDDYRLTIVAHERRDFVWIMADTPRIARAAHDDLVLRVARLGYDTARLRIVPQRPLEQRAPA